MQPELVQQVENDLQSIMAGGTARDVDILFVYVVVFFLLSLGVSVYKGLVNSMRRKGMKGSQRNNRWRDDP